MCILTLLCLLCGTALLIPGMAAATVTPDVRILIDVSGSMRQNDPQNLRAPALRLVNELLPAGARAGVWVFAEDTQVLAPPGAVDDAWKARTRASLGRIHSRGQLTDIERALGAALVGWDQPDPEAERHIVLLTDGLVDVGQDDTRDAASRERILSTQVQRLEELDVKVHVIALSDNVDAELMQALSEGTGGWLETPADAEALQRVFLHMLEQSAAPETVPLEGNRFDIDDRISELTLLAFRVEGQPNRLVAPDGEVLSAEQPGAGVGWHQEDGYDLVTVTGPQAGEWRLEGAQDPDNRVAVVTDMGLETEPLPSLLQAGEQLRLRAWLTDHQRPVERADLLRLLDARVRLEGVDAPGQTYEQPLALDPASARFTTDLSASALEPGTYDLQVVVDGTTFLRQVRKRIRVAAAPVKVRYAPQIPAADGGAAALAVTIETDPEAIDPTTLFGHVRVQGPDGGASLIEVDAVTESPARYALPIVQPGTYEARARLGGRTVDGGSLIIESPPESILFDFAPPPPETAAALGEVAWLRVALYVLAGNAILLLLLAPTWVLLRRYRPQPAIGGAAAAGKAGAKPVRAGKAGRKPAAGKKAKSKPDAKKARA